MEEIFLEIKLDLKEELKNFSNKDNQYTIPIFIPHKGCPNNCIFCNQRKISGQIDDVTVEDVDNIIKKLCNFAVHPHVGIGRQDRLKICWPL